MCYDIPRTKEADVHDAVKCDAFPSTTNYQ